MNWEGRINKREREREGGEEGSKKIKETDRQTETKRMIEKRTFPALTFQTVGILFLLKEPQHPQRGTGRIIYCLMPNHYHTGITAWLQHQTCDLMSTSSS